MAIKSKSGLHGLDESGSRGLVELAGWLAIGTIVLGACGSRPNPARGLDGVQPAPEIRAQAADEKRAKPVDPSHFIRAALLADIALEERVLSDGTRALSYVIQSESEPHEHAMGPWSPKHVTDGKEKGGIWMKDGELYDVDGPFVASIGDLYSDSDWDLVREDGSIRVTETKEAFEAAARPDVDSRYHNHVVEGRPEWIEQKKTTYVIPAQPIFSETPIRLGHGPVGVAFNGVNFDPPAPLHAILAAHTIAPLDDYGGHLNPHAGYHYHAATGRTKEVDQGDGHAAMIGYALDGFAIYAHLNEQSREPQSLDECGGHIDSKRGYHYHAGAPGSNQIIHAFRGVPGTARMEGEEQGEPGPPPHRDPPPGARGRPDRVRPGGPELQDQRQGPMEAIDLPESTVSIAIEGEYRVIRSNGLPDHEAGTFPNEYNPNAVRPQTHEYRVPLNPKASQRLTPAQPEFGIALNGVLFDSGTGEFWTASGQRGQSPWNYDAASASNQPRFGLDRNHAHVQPTGKYHYHGLPTGLMEKLGLPADGEHPSHSHAHEMTLLGWAFDGYPIYAPYSHEDPDDPASELVELEPSYRLKQGNRPDPPEGPGGRYDGTFGADYEYVEGSGHLDRSNGRSGVTPEFPKGTYYYVVTRGYPTIPRTWHGIPGPTVQRRGPVQGSDGPPPPGR